MVIIQGHINRTIVCINFFSACFFLRESQVGAKVYALKDHAKFLAKELLIPTGKGTDASNCHDEEADEEEFSDDEEVQWCA